MYRRVLIEVPGGKRPLYLLEKDGVILLEKFRRDAKKLGGVDANLRNIETAIVLRAKGDELPVKRHKKLKHRVRGDEEYEYRSDRLRLYAFEDGDAEIITFGTLSKREEDTEEDVNDMRLMKEVYLNLKESNQLITINEKGEVI